MFLKWVNVSMSRHKSLIFSEMSFPPVHSSSNIWQIQKHVEPSGRTSAYLGPTMRTFLNNKCSKVICLYTPSTSAHLGCNITYFNSSVVQEQLVRRRVFTSVAAVGSMWTCDQLATGSRPLENLLRQSFTLARYKVSSQYCALNLWRISADFIFSFTRILMAQSCCTVRVADTDSILNCF